MALKSKKDPKALEKIQALADKLFADGGEEKTVQEGSEILNELEMYTFQTLLELGTLDRVEKAAYVKFSEVAKELRNSVVVPEEKWKSLEKLLFFENVLEGDVLIPQAKWERIKMLIENFPKYKMKDDGNVLSALVRINLDINKWLEELRKAVMEE